MKVTAVFSFLVHAGKHLERQPEIVGTKLPLSGNLFDMLTRQFEKALTECNIDIAFVPAPDGTQNNQCRNVILSLLQNANQRYAKCLAERLQCITTNRSGLGLLFIILGSDNHSKRVYISRFPADFGIIAKERKSDLHIQYIEKVFMRNAQSYKAAVYEDSNFSSGFWTGRAIDKQINNNEVAISSYWIVDFLMSTFRTTAAQGTRRLALAIRITIDSTDDMTIKGELTAAARLAASLDGQIMTMQNFAERFALSEKARKAVVSALDNPAYRFDQFVFSAEEFSKHIRYLSVQISNGAVLTAPVGKFDECFTRHRIEEDSDEYQFTTRGSIVNESLKKGVK